MVSDIQIIAQQSVEIKSTSDLSFLIGKWDIRRSYNPNSDSPRVLNGSLVCKESMDSQFIKCTYLIDRPGKKRALDQVYFNYNSVYNTYESIWLSSTWPIKVLMHGDLIKNIDKITLNTSAQFLIENGITEYVKDVLVLTTDLNGNLSFMRQTFIKTDKEKNEKWLHHMNEQATLTKE